MSRFRVTKKDFELTWFNGHGGGGQHKNKHANCARLKHKDTGIITIGQDHKERPRNQKDAVNRMANNPRFLAYCEERIRDIERGQTLQQLVDNEMSPENLVVQFRDGDKWVNENHNKHI